MGAILPANLEYSKKKMEMKEQVSPTLYANLPLCTKERCPNLVHEGLVLLLQLLDQALGCLLMVGGRAALPGHSYAEKGTLISMNPQYRMRQPRPPTEWRRGNAEMHLPGLEHIVFLLHTFFRVSISFR